MVCVPEPPCPPCPPPAPLRDLSTCTPIVGEEGTYGAAPAWGWCPGPACRPTEAQVAHWRQQARERGEFLGSRFCNRCLAAWRAAIERERGRPVAWTWTPTGAPEEPEEPAR